MKINWDNQYLKIGLTAFCVIVASMAFFFLLFRLDVIGAALGGLVDILAPFIYALIFVFLLVPIMTFFEQHLLSFLKKRFSQKIKEKNLSLIARVTGILITVVLALMTCSLLIGMILPQLITSISGFVNDLPGYLVEAQTVLSNFLADNPQMVGNINTVITSMTNTINEAMPNINNMISGLASGAWSVVVVLKNILVGLIVSIYIMFSKERFVGQSKKFCYALFDTKRVNHVLQTLRHIHRVFYGFLSGKLLDSLIIGLLCYIAMSILRMPFSLLISTIIGVSNIVPFFGPIIGAVPCAIILLLEDPLQGLYFIILILVLQQFDGNILEPKILGDSTGLSTFWIIFAIVVGGGLFGVPGMIIGAPLFAVFYDFAREGLVRRLKKKGLPTDTDDFIHAHSVDPHSKKIVEHPQKK